MPSDPYQNSLSLSIVTIPLALKHGGMRPWLLGCTYVYYWVMVCVQDLP